MQRHGWRAPSGHPERSRGTSYFCRASDVSLGRTYRPRTSPFGNRSSAATTCRWTRRADSVSVAASRSPNARAAELLMPVMSVMVVMSRKTRARSKERSTSNRTRLANTSDETVETAAMAVSFLPTESLEPVMFGTQNSARTAWIFFRICAHSRRQGGLLQDLLDVFRRIGLFHRHASSLESLFGFFG